MKTGTSLTRIAAILALAGTSGCLGTAARMPTLAEPACRGSFSRAIASILVGQGEPPALASRLGDSTVQSLIDADLGPRPFEVSTNYPADYDFLVTTEKSQCVLNLIGRTRNNVSVSGTIAIASQPFSGCVCTP
jgi:hypothetical protein